MKFEKLHQLKKGKHAVTAGCLALGIVMLSTSVYASYDDANGYKNYKESVKRLVFDERNVTADIDARIEIDGEELAWYQTHVAVDGNNYREKDKGHFIGDEPYGSEHINVIKGNKEYYVNVEDKTYFKDEVGEYANDRQGLLNMGLDKNDPTTQKMVRFVELLGDAFVGDIKNNVVLESKEDGVRYYTVSASEVQIPELINAGVAVAFGTMNGGYGNYVTTRYIDYDKTRENYYKERTGKDLPVDYGNRDDSDEIYEILDELYDKEDEIIKGKNKGVVIVYEDASMKYYETMADAMADKKNEGAFYSEDVISKFTGGDAWIKSGTNDFAIDEDGRLLSTEGNVIIASRDLDGVEHEIKFSLKVKFSDYGTTEIELPDLSDYAEKVGDDPDTIKYTDDAVGETKEVVEVENKADAVKEDKDNSKDSDAKKED